MTKILSFGLNVLIFGQHVKYLNERVLIPNFNFPLICYRIPLICLHYEARHLENIESFEHFNDVSQMFQL